MRRTMHAALVALCFSAHAYGQSPDSTLPAPVYVSPEVAGAPALPQAAVTPIPHSIEVGASGGCSHCGGSIGPVAHPMGCDRPYSPLGARMSCNEYSPMLWGTYPAERAAAIAHSMKHVNHQCGCGHHRNILHSHASAGCASGGCHTKAACDSPASCDSVVVNRYQAPAAQPNLNSQPPLYSQSQSVVGSKGSEGTLFGIKLPSWTSKAPAAEVSGVKVAPASPAKATPVSPYLKSEPQLPKMAMLNAVATEPGPAVLAR